MLKRLTHFFQRRGTLMFFTKPLLQITIKHFSNSRAVRNMVQEVDLKLSDRETFLNTLQARRLMEDRIIYVDVGARGGPQGIISSFHGILFFIICEADEAECRSLKLRYPKEQSLFLEVALADQVAKRNLYLTRKPGCSSLLKPTGNALALRGGNERDLARFEIVNQVEIETSPLYLCIPKTIKHIDILKIDVQGFEFEILSGLGDFRPVLIVAECSAAELYTDQKSIFSVGSLLEKHGYMALKLMETQLVPKTCAKFQSSIQIHGDVIFVPDNSANGIAIIERDVEKWFAALCMHGYMDFALWQIEELKIRKPELITQTEELLRKS